MVVYSRVRKGGACIDVGMTVDVDIAVAVAVTVTGPMAVAVTGPAAFAVVLTALRLLRTYGFRLAV